MKKNLLYNLLVLTLLLAILSGCGNEPTVSSAEPTPASTVEEVTEAPAPAPTEEHSVEEEASIG